MRPSVSPTPIRIVHVVDSLEPGGLERVTCDLALAQSRKGHDVSVFSLLSTSGFKDELISSGISVIEGNKSQSLDLQMLGKLRKWVMDRHADVVHAHNFVPNYHAALACLGLRGMPRPAQVCTIHDMGTRLTQRKLRWLFLASLRRTQQVAMVGQRVHQRFVDNGFVAAGRACTVLNGIPVSRFTTSDASKAAARQALGVPASATLIGCVGRLVPLKNHSRMIDVFAELRADHPGLHLAIVGDGECRDALRDQIAARGLQDGVTLFGHHPNVSQVLPAFDIFALPSQTEGLSIALLEACASQLAIVATDVGGNPEIIQDGQTGLLVPVDDNRALSQAIRKLLDDQPLRHALGQRARDWVSANASDVALEQAYDSCYRKAMDCLHPS